MPRWFSNSHCITYVVLLLGLTTLSGCAALPATPQQYTLWTFLGLDPYCAWKKKETDHLWAKIASLNPAFAPTTALKPLTDPSMAQSPNVAVASAAAVVAKKADVPQTKAALAAVAEIGCACDPNVATALAAGLDSCFPEVRLAAAEAVRTSVRYSENQCDGHRCCSPVLSEKLFRLGWGVDDLGCPIEPDGNVRLAARQAFRACGCTPFAPIDGPLISMERPRSDVVKSAKGGDPSKDKK